jgi:hypothetical protein
MQQHVNSLSLSSGSTSLIAAPGAGLRIVVLGFTLATGGTATNVLLGFSATNQRQFRFPATAGNLISPEIRWEGDTNAALTINPSANGPTDVSVDYTIETSPG